METVQGTSLLITTLTAFGAGYLFQRLKVPGGMLIGAVVATTILTLTTPYAVMPYAAKFCAQICAGAFIACSIKREDFLHIIHNWKAPIVLLVSMLILNLFAGTVLHAVTELDLVTCYMCAIPGGITDVTLISEELGGDQSIVLVSQIIRMLSGLIVFPLVASKVDKTLDDNASEQVRQIRGGQHRKLWQLIVTLLIAFIGGFLGRATGIPAGTLVGAMLTVLIWNIASQRAYMSKPVRRITQSLAGAYIGCSIGMDSIILLKEAALGMILVGVINVLGCLCIAYILHRTCKLSKRSTILAAMPAGTSEVAFIAADMHVNISDVAAMQIIRLVVVMSTFPQIIMGLIKQGFPYF